MARTVITRVSCDQCGCLCKDGMHGTVTAVTRDFTDAAGSLDSDQEQLDLCVLCLAKGYTALLGEMLLPYRCEWLAKVKWGP